MRCEIPSSAASSFCVNPAALRRLAGDRLQAAFKTPSVTSPKRSVTFPNSAVTAPKRAVTIRRNRQRRGGWLGVHRRRRFQVPPWFPGFGAALRRMIKQRPLAGHLWCRCCGRLQLFRLEGVAVGHAARRHAPLEPADPLRAAAVGEGLGPHRAAR